MVSHECRLQYLLESYIFYYKLKKNVSCEIEDFVETHTSICKLRGILRSRVLLIEVVCDLIKDVSPY